MSRRLLLLVLTTSLLGLRGSASAVLVARWTFNNSPNDQVGALNWTLNGGATYSTDHKEGSHSLQCDGKDDYASLAGSGLMSAAFSTKTVMLWFRPNATTGTQILYDEGGANQGVSIRINNGMLEATVRASNVGFTLATPLADTNWSHVAISFDSGPFKLYLNGVEVGSVTASFTTVPSHTGAAGLGVRNGGGSFGGTATGDYYGGLIDDVQVDDSGLSQAQIAEAMLGWPRARQPSPANGAQDVGTPLFQWTAGNGARWHDVYLGTDPNLGPASLVAPRSMVTVYWHVPGLVPGTAYYWRVDEVGADGVVYTGDVWSFVYSPKEAWQALPADGEPYTDANVTLSWKAGLNAISHDVYFGADQAAVTEGTGDVFKGNQVTATFKPGVLELDTTYFWRIDEVAPDGMKVKGNVWTFKILPAIAVTDPNLAAWWTFDEGRGMRAVDWSGHGHHADFVGPARWVPGYDGTALGPTVAGQYLEAFGWPGILGKKDRTCTAWIKTTATGDIMGWGLATNTQKWVFRVQDNNGNPGSIRVECQGGRICGWTDVRDGEWHHVAAVLKSAGAPTALDIGLYVDGVQEAISDSQAVDVNTVSGTRNVRVGDAHQTRPFPGLIDDARIYDRALTQEELQLVMRIDPLRAWGPEPRNGSLADVRTATPLRWTKGDNASKHEVYLGTDAAAVADANASDTTGVYRGRITATSFTPDEDLPWGRKYFWRIDEINTEGTTTAGKVWTFTVADYLIVDDFETYTDVPGEAIFDTWIDGVTNGQSGSTVGNFQAPFAERTIVYHGSQAMPLDYNNAKSPWYSETERTLAPLENWTFGGVDTLVVHFRGAPVDFLESAGTITLSAAGTDIWNTADEFRYAFKRLTGDGSIVARVDSITNTDVWAKGGVMIRETLDPGSRQAMVVVTPGSGVAFQRRLTNNDVSVTTTQGGLTAPRWVKLTRTGNLLTAQHSADGVTWVDVVGAAGTSTSDTVVMGGTIYIGAALTSHAASVACTAVFSNIKTTGNVTGSWQQAEVGVDHPGNSAQGLYVGIEDSAGKAAFVTHADPAATAIGAWTEWAIPLTSFTGVNPAKVKKMYFGVGDRKNPVPDGAGRIYIDDLRVTKGAPAQPNATP